MAGLVDFSLGDIGQVLVRAREAITGERITDPTELAKIDLELAKMQEAVNTGQIEINKIEAAHKSLFVAGWRPFIGWVCGFSISYAFVVQPLIEWAVRLYGSDIATPTINTDTLYQLVIAMLGLAGLRTYEKKNQVAREK